MKLSLPDVTLLCADCVDAARAVAIMDICTRYVDFGAVRLLTSKPTTYPHRVEILPLTSLVAYSIFMLTRAAGFVETSHMLVVQWDGYILNPKSWNPAWLSLDYIGPLYQQYAQVGSGGFSLRSKELMARVGECVPAWDGTADDAERLQATLGVYEDGVVSLALRPQLEQEGFQYATVEQAAAFAQGGNNDPRYHVERPFGFHRKWANVNLETGAVSPPPFR